MWEAQEYAHRTGVGSTFRFVTDLELKPAEVKRRTVYGLCSDLCGDREALGSKWKRMLERLSHGCVSVRAGICAAH